jgi:hypothetical protein
VKFSVKSVYPISTSLGAEKSQPDWELTAMELKDLFVGYKSRKQDRFTQGNHDLRYVRISVFKQTSQIDKKGGGTDTKKLY